MKKMISLLLLYQLMVTIASAQSNSFPDIILTSPDYPKIDFNGRILYRGVGGNNLTWRYDGINDAVLIHSANFNNYVPSLTGAGASGSWNINAASAGVWSGQSFGGVGDSIGYYMLGHSTGNSWAAYTPDKVKRWLGMPAAGETLQSVMERGNTTSRPLYLNGYGTQFLIAGNNNNYVGSDLNIRRSNTSPEVGRGIVIQLDDINPVSASSHMIQGSGEGLQFFNTHAGADWQERMRISTSGNVGIGAVSPAEKLHVVGNTRSEGQIRFYTPYPDAGGNSGIVANPNGWTRIDPNGGRFIMTVFKEDVDAARNILDIERVDTWQKLMELKADGSGFFQGNIGIGTSAPQSKLAVNGDITTKKIKVTQTGWPDYVFESSYQLAPISYVEKFIQENKHLPEVPSAAEVKKDGLDLGDNQAVLLKKIEELTLYIIQQNKEIIQQNKEVAQLKKRVADLEAK
ncbi:FtsB/FtsL family cell division protein [Filimonas effusa]|uniref:Peptidase S74 domain-containing protein n=1 Tax=Filimonas effusa TaxID=2508721 RepID=A0A4Q1DDT7_9BACT|nr:DUF4200 domain-containing protein [Filimonas effusa]RXK86749.1 hypothetical protein ESB13_08090 [Filimonas effusa]